MSEAIDKLLGTEKSTIFQRLKEDSDKMLLELIASGPWERVEGEGRGREGLREKCRAQKKLKKKPDAS